MNFTRDILALALALLAGPAFAQTGPAPAILKPKPAAMASVAPAEAAHALTADDVGAYVDGLIPYAMQRGDVAGIVVVVVKDDHILFEKGYGYADAKAKTPVDPKTTLFRPGSISKLFTWTAVMQLVQAHKLDLDRDVNSYLDFKIPEGFGKPITLRNLMTHTPGFEEAIRNLGTTDPKAVMALGPYLREWTPERIYPPGDVPAYSNWGAALAGYIVQRVSGEPFETYVARHIFAPLDMHHASFAQPLPRALAGDMSKGYNLGSDDPKPFEFISVSPAGALSASGEDIAHFMMAHLDDGAYGNTRILDAATARQMHATAFRPDPALPGMALGFYHEDRNGETIIGHGGDTVYFHSDLHLLLDRHVGLFFSQNSQGKTDARIRKALFEGFLDRYFPAPPVAEPATLKTAAADAKLIAGSYIESRRSASNFLKVASLLGAAKIIANADGTITTDDLHALNGTAIKWREIAPQRWRALDGPYTLDAKITNGRVTQITTDQFPPIEIAERATVWNSPVWNLPLLVAMIAMLTLTAIFWPVKAVLRWRYKRPLGLTGYKRLAYRWSRLAALVDVAAIAGWLAFIALGTTDLTVLGSGSDWIMVLLQTLTGLGVILTAATLWELREAFADGERPWWTKASDTLLALAALSFVWFSFSLHFLNFSLNY